MKINYIIATYNGFTKRQHKYPEPKNVLKCHLEKILSLEHSLSQITIMKAKSINYYENYYDISEITCKFNIPIKIIDVENYGYSEGLWLKAYELSKHDFDYYLFIEDDYCPGMDKFDTILLNTYNKNFPNKIGLLCSLVQGSKHYNKIGGFPIHFEGAVFTSKENLEKLYNFPKWNRDPRKWLDLIDKSVDPHYDWKRIRERYLGAYYQLTFSHLFTLASIDHQDYLNRKYNNKLLCFPYWEDLKNEIGGKIIFFNHGNTRAKSYSIDDIYNSPIIPIQLINIECITHNTPLKINSIVIQKVISTIIPIPIPKIIFVIGMHRCGTSLLCNCLVENGCSIGKTKNKDKNWQNPNGYFENDELTKFHDELLSYNDSKWNDIKTAKMKYTNNHVNKYRNLLKTEFNNDNKILIKDPRLTFFVDFLKEVCQTNYEYKFLFITRDETECCNSLAKAQKISISNAKILYDITHKCYSDSFLKIDHHDILFSNKDTLDKIFNFCNLPIKKDTSDIVNLDLYRNKR